MGSVYKAEQPSMNRLVAIKVLHARFADRDDLLSRFRREARAMSQLAHPNTARVYKYGTLPDGASYFVMDFLEGKNLAHVVREQGPMAPDRAINIMIQVCGALDEAHRAGIVHRDLKPENIFLTNQAGAEDFPKLLDFGLAKVSEKQMGRGSMVVTKQGMVFGTPEFMSPEQTQGEELDRRSDVYSLGLILYELLTGKLPFDAKKPIDVMKAHVREPPIPLNQRLETKRFGRELEAVIGRALEKKKSARFDTTLDLADALRRCLGGEASVQAQRAIPSSHPPPASSASSTTGHGDDVDPPVVPVSRLPLVLAGVGIGLAVAVLAFLASRLING